MNRNSIEKKNKEFIQIVEKSNDLREMYEKLLLFKYGETADKNFSMRIEGIVTITIRKSVCVSDHEEDEYISALIAKLKYLFSGEEVKYPPLHLITIGDERKMSFYDEKKNLLTVQTCVNRYELGDKKYNSATITLRLKL